MLKDSEQEAIAAGVSAVIPARNEAARIDHVIASLRRDQPELLEIIVVDDGSDDHTSQTAEAAGATTVIHHPVSRGYGAAVKSGILASKGKFVLTVDGDGQHHSRDVAPLLHAAAKYDLLAGHRMAWFHSSAWRLPGKWILRQFGSFLVRRRIPDLNCGLRVYRREAIVPYLPLCSDMYSFTATSTLLMISWGYRVEFIPVDVRPSSSQGRVTVRTGLDTLLLVLRIATLLDPLRVFLPISIGAMLVGIAWGTPYAIAGKGVSTGALLLILTGLIVFVLGLLSDQIAKMRKEHHHR